MSLRLDDRQHLFNRSPETAIDPWGEFHQPARLRRLKDEQADNLLHPGGADLGRSSDDHIVLARFVTGPPTAVAGKIAYHPERFPTQHGEALSGSSRGTMQKCVERHNSSTAAIAAWLPDGMALVKIQ